MSRASAWLWTLACIGACSGGGAECVVGTSQDCACADGSHGAQVCMADHTFGACSCTGGDGGTPADLGAHDASATVDSGSGDAGSGDAGGVDSGGTDSGGTDSGSGGCFSSSLVCDLYTDVHPGAPERDTDSVRESVVDVCIASDGSYTLTATTDCGYDERCTAGSPPTCVNCGVNGNRSDLSMRDSTTFYDCRGCLCDRWTVLACYDATTSPYHEASIELNWYADSAFGMHVDVTPTGTYLGPYVVGSTAASIVVHSLTVSGSGSVAPGGAVDMTVSVDATYTDSLGVSTRWTSSARVIDVCRAI